MVADAQPAPEKPWWRKPTVWIGFIISGLAIGLFIYKFDIGKVQRSLLVVRWWSLVLAGTIFFASYMVRGLRWKLLLEPLARLPFGQVRNVLMTGFMLNCLLPARAGEIARPLILWRVAGTSRRAGLATVGVERVFDGLCLVGLLALVGTLFQVPPTVRTSGYVVSALMGLALLVVLWLAFAPASLFRVFDATLFFLPRRWRDRLVGFFDRFEAGTHVLRSPGLALRAGLLTMLIWGMEVVVYLTVMRGFGIGLPLWTVAVVLVATNFGIAAPSAPGFIGVFEMACGGTTFALARLLNYPMERELALSYAIVVHVLLWAVVVGTGLITMWRLGLRFGDLTKTK